MQGHTPFGRVVRHCAVRISCARQRVWVREGPHRRQFSLLWEAIMKRSVPQLVWAAVLGAALATVVQSKGDSFREKYKRDYPPLRMEAFKSPDPFVGRWEI